MSKNPATARRLLPWQEEGVGVPITGALTTKEALRLGGHDWRVEKVHMMTAPKIVYLKDEKTNEDARDADGNKIKDVARSENHNLFGITNPVQVMTVRVNTLPSGVIKSSYLGTVGVGYQVVQNDEYCEFFDEALGKGAAAINAVGTLGRFGARVFMVAKVPEMLEVVPGDPVERYILLTNCHDGSANIEARFIAFREQSASMVHTPGEIVKIRHTKNAKDRVKEAHRVLAANEDYWNRAKRAYAYMAKRDANTLRVRAFLEALFPDIIEKDDEGNEVKRTSHQAEKARADILELFEGKAPGADKAGKTDWGLYNAVGYYVDHGRKRSKKQDEWQISRWEVSVFGPGADLRDHAFTWLTRNAEDESEV
jgi:phage/plasmid-like protein (TIGR03299 family)